MRINEAVFQPIERDAVIATAERYRWHIWMPTIRNVFHGQDKTGLQVDTPDINFRPPGKLGGYWVPGQLNIGVPYKWGGFDSIADCDEGVKNGKYAGDLITKGRDGKGVSNQAVGVDCSGFVSRCFNLPHQYSTLELPDLTVPLSSPKDLRPLRSQANLT